MLTLFDGGQKLYRYYIETIKYKENLNTRISSLSAGLDIDYFTEMIDFRPAFKNQYDNYQEYIYVHELFYIQAITDQNNKVLMYSVTTRDYSFNPKLVLDEMSQDNKKFVVILGQSTFGDVEDYLPESISAGYGARRAWYHEKYYFGNPGLYQNYIIAYNDAGVGSIEDFTILSFDTLDQYNRTEASISPDIKKIRNHIIVNTYSIGNQLGIDGFSAFQFGPDLDQVRLLKLIPKSRRR